MVRWLIENKLYLFFLFSVRISFNINFKKIWYIFFFKNSSRVRIKREYRDKDR